MHKENTNLGNICANKSKEIGMLWKVGHFLLLIEKVKLIH